MKRLAFLGLMLFAMACSGSKNDAPKPAEQPPPSTAPSPYIDGFSPPPVADGFTRYILPPIRGIKPGYDHMWCQYLEAPATDQDYDIVWVDGVQSKGGHHLVLYSTTGPVTPAATEECVDADMVSVRFLGGVGGEGATSLSKVLVPGTVFRMPKGSRYMANVHYINATDHPIDGQGVIDIKIGPPD